MGETRALANGVPQSQRGAPNATHVTINSIPRAAFCISRSERLTPAPASFSR